MKLQEGKHIHSIVAKSTDANKKDEWHHHFLTMSLCWTLPKFRPLCSHELVGRIM